MAVCLILEPWSPHLLTRLRPVETGRTHFSRDALGWSWVTVRQGPSGQQAGAGVPCGGGRPGVLGAEVREPRLAPPGSQLCPLGMASSLEVGSQFQATGVCQPRSLGHHSLFTVTEPQGKTWRPGGLNAHLGDLQHGGTLPLTHHDDSLVPQLQVGVCVPSSCYRLMHVSE